MTPVDPAAQTNGLLFFEYNAGGISLPPTAREGIMEEKCQRWGHCYNALPFVGPSTLGLAC